MMQVVVRHLGMYGYGAVDAVSLKRVGVPQPIHGLTGMRIRMAYKSPAVMVGTYGVMVLFLQASCRALIFFISHTSISVPPIVGVHLGHETMPDSFTFRLTLFPARVALGLTRAGSSPLMVISSRGGLHVCAMGIRRDTVGIRILGNRD